MTEFGFTMNAPAPKSRKPWIVLAGAAVVVALAAFVIAKSLQPPADFEGAGTGEVLVTVVKGDTGRAIGHRLHDAGVIASVEAWLAATANDARATKIAPGDYNMREKMSAADAFALILDPAARAYLKLVIPEGLRVKQIIERASDVSGIPVADFEAALTDAKAIGLPSIANGNPEGFLFPATYEIGKNDKAVDRKSVV